MRRRRLVVCLVVGAALGLAGLWGLSVPAPKPGVRHENFNRLRLGMTESETQALLGEPTWSTPGGNFKRSEWLDKRSEYVAVVLYADSGDGSKLVYAHFITEDEAFTVSGEDTFLDRLRRLIPW